MNIGSINGTSFSGYIKVKSYKEDKYKDMMMRRIDTDSIKSIDYDAISRETVISTTEPTPNSVYHVPLYSDDTTVQHMNVVNAYNAARGKNNDVSIYVPTSLSQYMRRSDSSFED